MKISADSTPLNMTKLNEKDEEIVEVEVITNKENIKKEDEVLTTVATPLIENKKQKKKKPPKEVVLKKLSEEEEKEKNRNIIFICSLFFEKRTIKNGKRSYSITLRLCSKR